MSLAPDRDRFWNASDAPAMLGISPYETRQALLERIKYGVQKIITPTVQSIFDAGHRIEALARPIAEALLGHALEPKRVTNGKLGATLDGYFCSDELEAVNWECKTLNDAIRAAFDAVGYNYEAAKIDGATCLPEYLCAQIEHQLLCSDADLCLFTAHSGDETVHCWYYPDSTIRQRIMDGWAQFERDLLAMPDVMPVRAIVGELMPEVREFPFMPLVGFGIVRGSLQDVARFENEGREFVKTINQNLVTDQDFADGESDKKNLAQAVKMLDTLLDAPQDMAALKRVRELFNKARLALEKQLAERKQARNVELVYATRKAYETHVTELDLAPYISADSVDFKPVIKQLSSVSSMQNALSAALLKAQSEANALAAKVRKNLALIADANAPLLFPNLRELAQKESADLANHIAVTLAKFSEQEKARVPDCPSLPNSEPHTVTISAPLPPAGEIQTMSIGDINARLRGVTIRASFLESKGFPGFKKGSWIVYAEADWPRIKAAIIEHVQVQS